MSSESRRVRVSLPAAVAADINQLKETVGSVLEHLGCGACCSGHDVFFELQRDVVFNDDLREGVAVGSGAARPEAGLANGTVSVSARPESLDNIKSVFEAIDRIAEISGCPSCATGCDLRFNLERVLVAEGPGRISERIMTVAKY